MMRSENKMAWSKKLYGFYDRYTDSQTFHIRILLILIPILLIFRRVMTFLLESAQ